MPRKQTRTPGHEPLLSGRPDPIAPPLAPHITHLPAGGGVGAACPVQPVPTHASEYDASNPTCKWCANYLAKTIASTKARFPFARVHEPPKPETT
jgi:hypothetical protein